MHLQKEDLRVEVFSRLDTTGKCTKAEIHTDQSEMTNQSNLTLDVIKGETQPSLKQHFKQEPNLAALSHTLEELSLFPIDYRGKQRRSGS